MPLSQCPICEKSISKRANACPSCGEPDPFSRKAKFKVFSFIFWITAITVGMYAFWTYGLPLMVDFMKDI